MPVGTGPFAIMLDSSKRGRYKEEAQWDFSTDKKILITGMLSNRSIAYGIAKAMHREGAQLAFTYPGGAVKDRVVDLAAEFDSRADASLRRRQRRGDRRAVRRAGRAAGTASTASFTRSHSRRVKRWPATTSIRSPAKHSASPTTISSYSFAALAKAGLPMMQGRKAALLTLTYLGAERALPSYNVMGLAKASLEANVRYMALSLGPKGIRVNAISAGPIKTLAAAGIGSFGKLLAHAEKQSPLRRNVTTEEVGNVAAFLCSDLASGITGEITYVDAGFNITGAGQIE